MEKNSFGMLGKISVVCLAYSSREEIQEFTDTNYKFTLALSHITLMQNQCHLYIITKTESVNCTFTELTHTEITVQFNQPMVLT